MRNKAFSPLPLLSNCLRFRQNRHLLMLPIFPFRKAISVFHSFFPQPKIFFTSLIVWTLVAIFGWYLGAAHLGLTLGFGPVPEDQQPIDLSFFLLRENIWFYGYFFLSALLFCGFWHLKA